MANENTLPPALVVLLLVSPVLGGGSGSYFVQRLMGGGGGASVSAVESQLAHIRADVADLKQYNRDNAGRCDAVSARLRALEITANGAGERVANLSRRLDLCESRHERPRLDERRGIDE